MMDYGQLMQQIKKMQQEIEKKQAELDAREFSASVGSGVVEVKALGTKEITTITIAPQLFTDKNQERIADFVRLAVNTVISEIETVSEAELGKLTGGVNLPGLF